MQIINKVLDYIFPPSCGICEKLGEGYICKECYQAIEKYLYPNNEKDIFYLLQYKEIIRQKIIEFKFNDKAYLHHMFCEILMKNQFACEFIKNYDIIIPVPMFQHKKAKRGYNQSELIAKKIAHKLSIPMSTKVLIKQKDTPMQSSLGKEERIKNVQNVYKIEHSEKIIGKKVLLVDDIYTTGATTKECKKMLELAGSKKVGILIIAKD